MVDGWAGYTIVLHEHLYCAGDPDFNRIFYL